MASKPMPTGIYAFNNDQIPLKKYLWSSGAQSDHYTLVLDSLAFLRITDEVVDDHHMEEDGRENIISGNDGRIVNEKDMYREMDAKILTVRSRPACSIVAHDRIRIATAYITMMNNNAKTYIATLERKARSITRKIGHTMKKAHYDASSETIASEEGKPSSLSIENVVKLIESVPRCVHLLYDSNECLERCTDVRVAMESFRHLVREFNDNQKLWNNSHEAANEAGPHDTVYAFTKCANMFLKWCYDEAFHQRSPHHINQWRDFCENLRRNPPCDGPAIDPHFFEPVKNYGKFEDNGVHNDDVLAYADEFDYDRLSTLFDFWKDCDERGGNSRVFVKHDFQIKMPLYVTYDDDVAYDTFVLCVDDLLEAFDIDAPRSSVEAEQRATPPKTPTKHRPGFKKYKDDYFRSRSYQIDRRNEYKSGTIERSAKPRVNDIKVSLTPPNVPVTVIDETTKDLGYAGKGKNIVECVENARKSVGFDDVSKFTDPRWITYPCHKRGSISPDVFDIWIAKSNAYDPVAAKETFARGKRIERSNVMRFVSSPEDRTNLVEATAYRWLNVCEVVDKDIYWDERTATRRLRSVAESHCVREIQKMGIDMKASPHILFSYTAAMGNPLSRAHLKFRLCYASNLPAEGARADVYALMRRFDTIHKRDVARWVKIDAKSSGYFDDDSISFHDAYDNRLNDIPRNALFLVVDYGEEDDDRAHLSKPPRMSSDNRRGLQHSALSYFFNRCVDRERVASAVTDDADSSNAEHKRISQIASPSVKHSNLRSFFDPLNEYDLQRKYYAEVGFVRTLWNHGYSRGITLSLSFGRLSLEKNKYDVLWAKFKEQRPDDRRFLERAVGTTFYRTVFELGKPMRGQPSHRACASEGDITKYAYFKNGLNLPVCYEYKRGVRVMPYTNEPEILKKYLEYTTKDCDTVDKPFDVLVHAGILATSCGKHADALSFVVVNKREGSNHDRIFLNNVANRIRAGKSSRHKRYDTPDDDVPEYSDRKERYETSDRVLDYGGLDEKHSAILTGVKHPMDCNRHNPNKLVSSWEDLDKKLVERFECNTAVVTLQDMYTNGRASVLENGEEDPTFYAKPPVIFQTLLSHKDNDVLSFRMYCESKRCDFISPIYAWCNNLQPFEGTDQKKKTKCYHWKSQPSASEARKHAAKPEDSGQTAFNCLRRGPVNDVSQITMNVDLEKCTLGIDLFPDGASCKTIHAHRCDPKSACAVVMDVSEAIIVNSSYKPYFLEQKHARAKELFASSATGATHHSRILAKSTNVMRRVKRDPKTGDPIKKAQPSYKAAIFLEKTALHYAPTNASYTASSSYEYEYVEYAGKRHRALLVEATAPWAFGRGIIVNPETKNYVSHCIEKDPETGYEIHYEYMGNAEIGSEIWPEHRVPTQNKQGELNNCFFIDRQPCYNLNRCYLSSLAAKYLQKHKAACKVILNKHYGNDATVFFLALSRYLEFAIADPEEKNAKKSVKSASKCADKYVLLAIYDACLELQEWDGISVAYDDHSQCADMKRAWYRRYCEKRESTTSACNRVYTALGLSKSKVERLSSSLSFDEEEEEEEDEDEDETTEPVPVGGVSLERPCDKKYCIPCAVERRARRCLHRPHLEASQRGESKETKSKLFNKRRMCNTNAQTTDASNVQYHVGCLDRVDDVEHVEIPQMCKFDAQKITEDIARYDLTLKWLLKLCAFNVLSASEDKHSLTIKNIKPWLDMHEVLKTGTR